uniref:Uncharacterized protein n=1 Tax=Siphoviridae sp. ct4Am4 TaxID=2826287 RepID=A0A8S5R294_9CAUD|nr:MAG TPA: hypothetical protein [Siphoviridae sp. ct4Am4]
MVTLYTVTHGHSMVSLSESEAKKGAALRRQR